MRDQILELEKLRKSQSLSLRQVARKLGCTEKSLNNWMKNGVTPSLPYQEKIIRLVADLRTAEDEKSDGQAIRDKLLDVLGQNYFDKRSGEDVCKFWRIARLTELRTVLAGTENVYDDNSIILQLERLCRKGLILCFGVDAADISDYKFYLEIGEGKYSWRPEVWPETTRLYRNSPLSPKELQRPEIILGIVDKCNRLEQERKRYFESRYGKPQTVEQQLIREDVLDNIEKRERENRLLKATEKLAGDEEKR